MKKFIMISQGVFVHMDELVSFYADSLTHTITYYRRGGSMFGNTYYYSADDYMKVFEVLSEYSEIPAIGRTNLPKFKKFANRIRAVVGRYRDLFSFG